MQILDVFLSSQAYAFVPLVPLQKPPRFDLSIMADLLLWLQGMGNLSASLSYECEGLDVDRAGPNYFTSKDLWWWVCRYKDTNCV